MKRVKILLNILIIVLFVLELISRWNNNQMLEFFVKPWLMVWIATYFMIFSVRKDYRLTALAAFFFSWLGDMFLMLAHTNEVLFFAGVGGFFISQLFYISLFLRFPGRHGTVGFLKSNPLWAVPFLAYLAIILTILLQKMEGLMIPVIIVYALSLIGMSLAALNRRGMVSKLSFTLLFIGSLLFVASDSMIAINKFIGEFPKSSFLIMLTYFAAQYLIMQGLLVDKGDTVMN